MKRFLALFAVVAIIGSMFAGVALAVGPAVACKIDLDQSTVNFTEKWGTAKITGRILDATSEALRKVDCTVELFVDADGSGVRDGAEVAVATDNAKDGYFDFEISTNTDSAMRYTVAGVTNADASFTAADADTFRVIYEIEIEEDLTLDFPVEGSQTIYGVLVNEDGPTAKADYTLAYLDGADDKEPGTAIATASFADGDEFGFLFDGDLFTKVGEFGLFVEGVLHAEGEIVAPSLDVTLTEEVTRKLGNQDIKFDFNVDEDDYVDVNNDRLQANYELRYTITDADDNALVPAIKDVVIVNDVALKFDDVDKQEITETIDFTNWDAGNYHVTVQLYDSSVPTVVLEKELDLKVSNPSKYTLMGFDLDDHNVGSITIGLPNNVAADMADGTVAPLFDAGTDENIEVMKYTTGTTSHVKYFEIEVNGCGIDGKKLQNLDGAESNYGTSKVFTADETGELEITIDVYEDPADDPVITYTKTVEIEGWNIELSVDELLVETTPDVVFVITDEDGNPVNNAQVLIGNTVVVNGMTSNIVGGQYTYEEDEEELFKNAGKLDVVVKKWNTTAAAFQTEVTLTDAIEVLGEEVYTVEVDKDVLVNGVEEEIYVSIWDENGDIVYPEFERIDVDTDGDESAAVALVAGSRKDLDGETGKEAVKLTIKPSKDQDEMIIRVNTENGNKRGEVRIDVQKPELLLTGNDTVTENIKTTFTFSVVDPRDHSVVYDDQVHFAGDKYFTYQVEDVDDQDVACVPAFDKTAVQLNQTCDIDYLDDYLYEVTVLAQEVNWDDAEDDEEVPTLTAYINFDGVNDVKIAEFEVAEASLAASPEAIVVNAPVQVTLTYTDANGNALAEKEIRLNDELVGETDENGQLLYAASSTSVLSLEFKAETNAKAVAALAADQDKLTTDVKVKSTVDMAAPTATAPATVDKDSVVVTIEDNVRVNKAMVNGQIVDIFFPAPKVTHIVTGLEKGLNTIAVDAVDINGNYAQLTLEVVYEVAVAPTPDVELTVGTATEFGTPELMNGTTLVPVRFATKLGAAMEWDNATKTVTYTLNDKVISMTVGSKTAVVNGENVTLTEAPFINGQNYTMVPLRMIAQELGFQVVWTSNDAPIQIVK